MRLNMVEAQSAPGVRRATRSDKDRFESVMTVAFTSDPLVRWAWTDPLQYTQTFVPFTTMFGGKAFDHDSAYVIGDFFGVLYWLPPGIQPDDEPMLELFQRNMSEPKLGQLLSMFEQMGGFHPSEPHWYIPLIATDPLYQGRGYGTELMRQGLLACDRDRQLAYLEATSPASRRFYERLGFRALGEIRSADSPPMFPMLREPR